jgi:hypothetical protein
MQRGDQVPEDDGGPREAALEPKLTRRRGTVSQSPTFQPNDQTS